MGVFDNLGEAEGYDKSKYFQEGRYLVEISKVKYNNGHRGGSFVIECTVLGAESTREGAPEVGQACAHVWRLGDYPEMAKAKWVRFLMAATGKGQQDLSNAQWSDLSEKVVAQNAMSGMKMVLECVEEPRAGKHPLTHHNWQRKATPDDFAQFGIAEA